MAFDPDKYIAEKQAPEQSGFDPDAYISEKEGPGIASRVGSAIGAVAKFANDKIDQYGRAPVRAGIGAAQDGQNPLTAFVNQFGQDPAIAPSDKQLAMKAGASDTPIFQGNVVGFGAAKGGTPVDAPDISKNLTYADAAGTALGLADDPTNLLPFAGGAVRGAGKVASVIGDLSKESLLGKGVSKVAGAVGDAAGNVGAQVGHTLTGVTPQQIKTYATQADEINEMLKNAGGSLPEAADAVRQGFQTKIQAKRAELGSQIQKALEAHSPERTIELQPVIDRLGEVHARVQSADPESAAQIEKLADSIAAIGGDTGHVTASEMQTIKERLQEAGKRSFVQDGQIFNPGTHAQIAAKHAAAEARQIVNAAVPGLEEPNNVLSQLHKIEDKLNPNLIAPGKSDAALMAVGSGGNPRNEMLLKRLGDLTGQDTINQAQKLSAARVFQNPSLTPIDATGKSLLRTGIGASAGMGAAHAVGLPLHYGAVAGAALSSPAALKVAIQAGKIPAGAINALTGIAGKVTDSMLLKAYEALKTSQGQGLLQDYMSQGSRVPADTAVGRRMQNSR